MKITALLTAALLFAAPAFAASVSIEPYAGVNFFEDLKDSPSIGVRADVDGLFDGYFENVGLVAGFEYSDSELEVSRVNKTFDFVRDYDVNIILLFIGAEYTHQISDLLEFSVGAGPEFGFASADNAGDFDNGVGLKVYGEVERDINGWVSISGQAGYRFMELGFDPGPNIHWFAQDDLDVELNGLFVNVSANLSF